MVAVQFARLVSRRLDRGSDRAPKGGWGPVPGRPVLVSAIAVLAGCSDLGPDDVGLTGPERPLAAAEARDRDRGRRGLDRELYRLLDELSPEGLERWRLPPSRKLNRIPQDPKNRLTRAKVELGRLLFHETALAVDPVRPEGRETYSCASCHQARAGFQANVPQGIGEGGAGFGTRGEGRVFASGSYDPTEPDVQPIRTPSVLNSAYQEIMLWDGRLGGVGANLGTEGRWTRGTLLELNMLGFEGVETQAHAGLATHRMADVRSSRVADIEEYQQLFARAFPGESDPVNRLNTALAIAAFERTVLANRSPWQQWLYGRRDALTPQEKEGAILFFGKADCVACHTGPALNSMTFHALGMGDLDASVDPTRVNLRPFGGAVGTVVARGRGGFTGNPADDFKFKTPQLYNLKDSPFYGHGATFSSVRDVIEYKNAAIPAKRVPTLSPLFVPLGLSAEEIDALTAFVEDALYDAELARYEPEALPSGNCAVVNDEQGRLDRGCDGS